MKMFGCDIDDIPGECFGLGMTEYGSVLADMDDIWTSLDGKPGNGKFELLGMPLGHLALDDKELDNILECSLDTMESRELVHHDCMWAGTCSDKYHPANGSISCPPFPAVPLVVPAMPPALAMSPIVVAPPPQLQTSTAGRSLLLSAARPPVRPPVRRSQERPSKKIVSQSSPKRPDTPQSLDEDEHPQFKHTIDLAAFTPQTSSNKTPYKVFIDYDYIEDQNDCEDDSDEGYVAYTHPAFDDRDARTHRENPIAADHSYTLCKTSKQSRLDSLGVQTPSDSEEEEIDVESLGGDKFGLVGRGPVALPTNPSALDRHQLQRTMASVMGARTIQPQRPGRPSCSSRPRKRPRDRSPPAQSSRYRKRKKITTDPRRSPTDRRAVSSNNSDSEAENIEKRSLHNDMERQRRIGLKNLFDELKREVPSIREKERAPKVVVLREAAALCLKLQREEREREQLRARQSRLLVRVRNLRLDLAARRPNA